MKRILGIFWVLILASLFVIDFNRIEGDMAWLRSSIFKTSVGSAIAELKIMLIGPNSDYESVPVEQNTFPAVEEAVQSNAQNITPETYGGGKIDNLAIVIPSCDKYHSVWKPFFTLLFKYWPDFQQPVYLISNTKSYDDSRVKTVLFPKEVSWSDNLSKALGEVKEDYVLIILEDFMINKPINVNQLREHFKVVQEHDVVFLQLVAAPFYPTTLVAEGLRLKCNKEPYQINCQAGIWKKEALKKLLVQHENPWEFEIYGTWRSKKTHCPILSVTDEKHRPISYAHAVIGGHWVPSVSEFLKKEGVFGETDLPIKEFTYSEKDTARILPMPDRESFRVRSLYS
jgi:hypothetical protein